MELVDVEAPTKRRRRKISNDELRQLLDRTQVEETVDTDEAAALLNMHPHSLRRWACYGSGPIRPRRAGARLRWSVKDIKAILSNGETATAAR